MKLRSIRNPDAKVIPAVMMIALVTVIVVGAGTGLAGKKKVTTISAHLVTLENVDGIFGVYPNELSVANGDVIKITNESGVTVELVVPENLFVNDKNEVLEGKDAEITIEPGTTQILNVYEQANTAGNEVSYTLEIVFETPTEKVQARPRIIVQPPSS